MRTKLNEVRPGALWSSVSEARDCTLSRWRAHTPGFRSRPAFHSYCAPTQWYSFASSHSGSSQPSWCAWSPSWTRCTSSPGTRQGRPAHCAVVCSASPDDTVGMPSPGDKWVSDISQSVGWPHQPRSPAQSPPYRPPPSSPRRTWRTQSHNCSQNIETFKPNLNGKPFSHGFFELQWAEDRDVNTEVFKSVAIQNMWAWVLLFPILRNTEVQPLWKS